jgi:TolB-like protein/Flp pilus assembly protein TadD
MECLTGRQTFVGETASDIIAMILEREPNWGLVPTSTPPRLVEITRRCLTKDTNRRPRDIGDIGRELLDLQSDSSRAVRAVDDTVPSLAVLYFENLANDPDSEYFCAGITEDILTDLSKIKGLKVASKNAVGRYRGTEVDHARVAEDLGVRALLEGSVRRAGDRIRITTQLINATDGFQLWAERFDRTLDDVFAVQDEIAAAIVDALRVAMTPSDKKEIARDRPDDAKAYDLYLKGREQYFRYTEEAMQNALEAFQQAIDIDPNYALAWAGIGDSHGQLIQYGWTEDQETDLRLGLEAAEKAISIDPELPDGYKAKALVLGSQGDEEGSRRALVRAIQVDPGFTPALINLAVSEFGRGNLAQSERLIRRTLEIDPQMAFYSLWLAWVLFLTNRFDECLAVARETRERSTESFYRTWSYIHEIHAHLGRGDVSEAEAAFAAAMDDQVDEDQMLPVKALIAAQAGREEEARSIIVANQRDHWVNHNSFPDVAATALRIGEREIAVHAMEQMRKTRHYVDILPRLFVLCHPLLDHPPCAPRKCRLTLTWPVQAPMVPESFVDLFKEIRIESGKPEGTNILGESSTGSTT